MGRVNIPDKYPKGCSDDMIKKVVEDCQDKIAKVNYASNIVLGTNYYSQVAEQGNSELNRRLSEKLISNLEKASKRQRDLTWSIIIIGGLNLITVVLKAIELI